MPIIILFKAVDDELRTSALLISGISVDQRRFHEGISESLCVDQFHHATVCHYFYNSGVGENSSRTFVEILPLRTDGRAQNFGAGCLG